MSKDKSGRFTMNIIAMLCASALSFSPASATTSARTDLSQIYQMALNNDPVLKAASATHAAGEYAVTIRRAALLPQAQLTLSLSQTAEELAGNNSDYHTRSADISLTQTLFDLPAWYQYRAAQAQQQADNAVLDIARQSLILRTASAYAETLRAEQNLKAAEAETAALKESLDQARRRHQAGLVVIIEVQEAQAAYDRAIVAEQSARAGLAVRYEVLQQLTNNRIDALAPLRSDADLQSPDSATTRLWTEQAWQQQAFIRQAQAELQQARASHHANRSRHLPTAAFTASYSKERIRGDEHSDEDTTTLSTTVILPLLSGGSVYGQRKQAQWQATAAEYTLEKQRRNVHYQVRQLMRQLNNNVQNIHARKQAILSAEVALAATENAHRIGTRNIVDVVNAKKVLFQVQRDHASARCDYLINLTQLKYYAGVLDEQDIDAINRWLTSTEQQS